MVTWPSNEDVARQRQTGDSMGSNPGDSTSRGRVRHRLDTSSRLCLADMMETHFTEPLES
ncbi:hypothetical protein BDQ94DRAFT_155544 [Aspergillus welwitschiae]|uniref:Uncharacterized protein n=1 Tax=Aspergillus welwitschiae TaxID=1341132 RepID=A0A3F3PHL6_9EURO|nr:hypothetical protein BDQ94DRAFT_155544 [Aspergillus welwitschiae]RDH26441.1 hypothetical protein BDQ94DRAFT_155544 [Aspergillus welwitschiae]